MTASPPSDQRPTTDRIVIALRRGTARLIDHAILSLVTIAGVGGLSAVGAVLSVAIGASAAGSGRVSGLFAGGFAALGLGLVIMVLSVVLVLAVPAVYYRWAARRVGELQGRSIGKATMGFRVERADGEPVRGRTLYLRDVMFGIAFFPVVLVALVVSGILGGEWAGDLVVLAALVWLAAHAGEELLLHDRMAATRLVDLRADEAFTPAGAAEATPGS